MISMILFITNLIIKFYNAFAIHKAIGKQASITKILLSGIFGIFSQALTQLVGKIQEEDDSNNSDDKRTHYGNNNSRKHEHTFCDTQQIYHIQQIIMTMMNLQKSI